MAESGKLKRLLVHKDKYTRSLYDIISYEKDSIKQNIVSKVLIFNSFKSQELKSKKDTLSLFNDLSIFQIIIDNFDYKKAGYTEGLVRDVSVILIGELA